MNKGINKILLVDDNNAANFYNRQILKQYGITAEIVVLTDGLKALNHIKNSSMPEIIFLDINMPVMGGVEFLDEVQKIETFKTTYSLIVVMSSTKLNTDANDKINLIPNVTIIEEKMLSKIAIDGIVSHFHENHFNLL